MQELSGTKIHFDFDLWEKSAFFEKDRPLDFSVLLSKQEESVFFFHKLVDWQVSSW